MICSETNNIEGEWYYVYENDKKINSVVSAIPRTKPYYWLYAMS